MRSAIADLGEDMARPPKRLLVWGRQGCLVEAASDACFVEEADVVAKGYENDRAICRHADSPQNQQPRVVLRCNIWADSILWRGAAQHGYNQAKMKNRSLKHLRKPGDNGKLSAHISYSCVVPNQNSIVLMGGTSQGNMIHWADRWAELLQASSGAHSSPQQKVAQKV